MGEHSQALAASFAASAQIANAKQTLEHCATRAKPLLAVIKRINDVGVSHGYPQGNCVLASDLEESGKLKDGGLMIKLHSQMTNNTIEFIVQPNSIVNVAHDGHRKPTQPGIDGAISALSSWAEDNLPLALVEEMSKKPEQPKLLKADLGI